MNIEIVNQMFLSIGHWLVFLSIGRGHKLSQPGFVCHLLEGMTKEENMVQKAPERLKVEKKISLRPQEE